MRWRTKQVVVAGLTSVQPGQREWIGRLGRILGDMDSVARCQRSWALWQQILTRSGPVGPPRCAHRLAHSPALREEARDRLVGRSGREVLAGDEADSAVLQWQRPLQVALHRIPLLVEIPRHRPAAGYHHLSPSYCSQTDAPVQVEQWEHGRSPPCSRRRKMAARMAARMAVQSRLEPYRAPGKALAAPMA